MITRYWANGAVMVALALAIVMMATLALNHPMRFPLDDAYITMANARQLLTGAVDDYGQTRPSGATSLLHLLMLAVLGAALEWPHALMVLSMLAALLYAAGLYLALKQTGVRSILVVLGTLAGFAGFKAWFQLMNGLETGWAMATTAWALYLVQRIDSDRHRLLLAVLIGMMPFIRPELAILSSTIAAMLAWRFRDTPAQLIAPALLAGASAGMLAVLALATTGEIIPLTGGAKVAFFADAGLPLTSRFLLMVAAVARAPLGFALIGLVAVPMLRGGWAFAAFVILFLLSTTATLPSGLLHNDQRYLYPLLPLALVGWAAFAARPDYLNGRAWQAVSLAAALAIGSFFVTGWRYYWSSMGFTDDQIQLVGWADRHLPSDARILIHDAGYMGWATDYRLVDLVGLKTPASIEVHRRYTLPSAGLDRSKAIAQIAAQQQVTHAIILDGLFWRDIADGLRQHGWRLDPMRKGPGTHYHVYRLTPPRPHRHGPVTPR